MAYTLPIASPFSTCWRRSVPVTVERRTASPTDEGHATAGRPSAAPPERAPRAPRGPLFHEDEVALGAVGVHLDLRHVRLLLHDLAAHARARRERDLPERRVVVSGDQLLVQLDAQRREVHLGDRRLLVERAQCLHEHLDAREGLPGELRRVLLLLVPVHALELVVDLALVRGTVRLRDEDAVALGLADGIDRGGVHAVAADDEPLVAEIA